jgi:hypothetical protein
MWVTGRSPVCNLMFFLMDTQSRVCYTAGGTTAADERKSARVWPQNRLAGVRQPTNVVWLA